MINYQNSSQIIVLLDYRIIQMAKSKENNLDTF